MLSKNGATLIYVFGGEKYGHLQRKIPEFGSTWEPLLCAGQNYEVRSRFFFFFVFDVNLTLAFCHALKGPHKGMVAKGVNSRIKRRCKGVTTSNVSRLCLNHVEKLDTARSSISSSFRSFPEGVAFARGRRRS